MSFQSQQNLLKGEALITLRGLNFTAANLGLLLFDFDDEKTHSPIDKNPTF